MNRVERLDLPKRAGSTALPGPPHLDKKILIFRLCWGRRGIELIESQPFDDKPEAITLSRLSSVFRGALPQRPTSLAVPRCPTLPRASETEPPMRNYTESCSKDSVARLLDSAQDFALGV